MANGEHHFITLCKKQIEQKYSFGNGHGYTQRDLEILSQRIMEETGVNISLSTLKRLWRNDFKQSPQLATLNALSSLLGYKDWQDFKLANNKKHTMTRPLVLGSFIVLVVLIVTSLLIYGFKNSDKQVIYAKPPQINGSVIFSTEKTITSGIPNTVIFKYDVSNVEADSFFIQQSWNDNHRVSIDPEGHAFSSIYYEPGYHRGWLIANDSFIAMQPVHILSDGWEPNIYNSEHDLVPINFTNENIINDGQLYISPELIIKKQVDTTQYFYSRISNSQLFSISSDNFSLKTRMKADSVWINSLCPWMNLIIVTEKNIFRVLMQKKGCERNVMYKLGEIERYGGDNDLSDLGCDIYSWQELKITVNNKNASININGNPAFQETYQEDYGNVMGLIYIFEGKGSIDYVLLKDGDGNIVFEDQFIDS